jgi:MFS family permease
MFLLFFETIRPEERTSVLTTFNFANAVATVSGSLLGGALLAWCGKSEATYLLLFGLSSAARALSVIALVRVPDFARAARLPSRGAAIEPSASFDPLILPALSGPHWVARRQSSTSPDAMLTPREHAPRAITANRLTRREHGLR